jgi:hypothetical protein
MIAIVIEEKLPLAQFTEKGSLKRPPKWVRNFVDREVSDPAISQSWVFKKVRDAADKEMQYLLAQMLVPRPIKYILSTRKRDKV